MGRQAKSAVLRRRRRFGMPVAYIPSTANVFLSHNRFGPRRSIMLLAVTFAAIGYSLVYLLLGGGLFGAFVIFVIAKMLGQ
jgi:hypothetical protein